MSEPNLTEAQQLAALPWRFREKIILAPSGCWIWIAFRTPQGYGRCSIKHVCLPAHRVAYTILVGPIPPGLHLDHLCRVRRCVNPLHLDPVTIAVNNQRSMAAITARNTSKTCKKGLHAWPDLAIYTSTGKRRCGPCHAATVLACKRRRRQAA